LNTPRILIVRLGAMGDIIHALPAAAHLRQTFPGAHIAWLAERRWLPLLEGNPNLNEVLVLDRSSIWKTCASALALRNRFDTAYDLQGLFKSAIPARLGAPVVQGHSQPREVLARMFFTHRVNATSPHIVNQFMEIAGAPDNAPREFWLPPGQPEGTLPAQDFVLASPRAGWVAKEWPHFDQLAHLLAQRGVPLVLNGAPNSGFPHQSTLAGLIHATRRAAAVIGVDSGPLHIAAALAKPGVAIFGPTDPSRNGPYGGSIRVLRHSSAKTSYRRSPLTDPSMNAISAEQVLQALGEVLGW
jgi:heptosyltransferase I